MKSLKNSVSAKDIQRLDKIAIEQYGIPSIVLMENAGRRTAEIILRKIKNKNDPNVCVICGTGNNGGDGFVAARYLLNAGICTKVLLIGKKQKLKRDAAVNGHILEKLGHAIKEIHDAGKDLLSGITKADVVVDAIFGVGLNRAIEGGTAHIIRQINDRGRFVVAVDVPSGLDATTGKVLGVCVRADITITFTLPKEGFFKDQGSANTGCIKIVDIGIPPKIYERFQ